MFRVFGRREDRLTDCCVILLVIVVVAVTILTDADGYYDSDFRHWILHIMNNVLI